MVEMKLNEICDFLSENDFNKDSIIITLNGNVKYIDKYNYLPNDCIILQSKNNSIKLKYIYFYLLYNFNYESIRYIEIPIITLEKQKYIIEYLSFIHENQISTLQKLIDTSIQDNEFNLKHLNMIKNKIQNYLNDNFYIKLQTKIVDNNKNIIEINENIKDIKLNANKFFKDYIKELN